jgi:hypothetical protein
VIRNGFAVLCIHGFYTCGFSLILDGEWLQRAGLHLYEQVQIFFSVLFQLNNFLHSIYTVLGITSNLEMI